MCIVYIKERYCFSLVCTFKNIVKHFEVEVKSQKGVLRFRGKFDIKCANFIRFTFPSMVVIW